MVPAPLHLSAPHLPVKSHSQPGDAEALKSTRFVWRVLYTGRQDNDFKESKEVRFENPTIEGWPVNTEDFITIILLYVIATLKQVFFFFCVQSAGCLGNGTGTAFMAGRGPAPAPNGSLLDVRADAFTSRFLPSAARRRKNSHAPVAAEGRLSLLCRRAEWSGHRWDAGGGPPAANGRKPPTS